MLHRFWNHEQAAIFASRMRSEGHFAELLHDNVGVLWGPHAVGGVAVWVSEEEIVDQEAEAEDEEYQAQEGEVSHTGFRTFVLPKDLSMTVAGIMVALPVALLGWFAFMLLNHARNYPTEALMILGVLLGYVLVALACLLFAATLSTIANAWLRAYRDPQNAWHCPAVSIHCLSALLLIISCTPLCEVIWVVIVYSGLIDASELFYFFW